MSRPSATPPSFDDLDRRLRIAEMTEWARDAMLRYVDVADRRDVAGLAQVFTPDATLSFEEQTWTGLDAIVAFFEANFVENHEQRRHFVTNLRIGEVTADHAVGTAYFLFVTAMGPEHSTIAWGRYEDRLERVGDRAQISAMRFHMDFVGDVVTGWAGELASRVAGA